MPIRSAAPSALLQSVRFAACALCCLLLGFVVAAPAAADEPAMGFGGSALSVLADDCGAGVDTGTAMQVSCGFTGGEQTFVVPSGVTSLHVSASGATAGQAWRFYYGSQTRFPGAVGATVAGDLAVTPGSILYINVGGQGGTGGGGGFNGGGGAGAARAASGGGASDVRDCSAAVCTSLGTVSDPRLLVGAGAGGCGAYCEPSRGTGFGGPGGLPSPGSNGGIGGYTGGGGGGGTQSGGGAGGAGYGNPCCYSGPWGSGTNGTAGQGGDGGVGAAEGAGGGGGYFGGGGGGGVSNAQVPSSDGAGGGGGSSYGGAATGVSYAAAAPGNGSVTITYVPAPTCAAVSSTIANDTSTQIQLSCTNHDTSQTYAVVDGPSHGTLAGLDATAGTVTYTPDLHHVGADSFTYNSTNSIGDSNTATVSLTVSPPPAPVCRPLTARTASEAPVEVTFDCSATAGYANTWATVDPPANGTLSDLDASAGTVTYTPAAGYAGDDTFTYKATNAGGDAVAQTVTVTVDPVPPACSAVSAIVRGDTATQVTLSCTSPVGYPVTFATVGNPAHGTLSSLDATAGAVTYTPDTGYAGPDSFTYRGTNAGGDSSAATVTIRLDATDPDAGITTPADGASFSQNANVTADYTCSDEAGGSGLSTCIGTVADGSAVDTSGYGSHSFAVTATDVAGNTHTVTVHYSVLDDTKPDANIFRPLDGVTYDRGAWVTAAFNCSDEYAGSGLQSCAATTPYGQPIDTSTIGAHLFSLTATDGAGNTRTVTATYRVRDITDPTVAIGVPLDKGIYRRGAEVTAAYSCADETGGSGVATCTGTVPAGDAIDTTTLGTHSFTLTATDNDGNTHSQAITYEVRDGTHPTVTIASPLDDARFDQGDAAPPVHFTCSDEAGGSGLESCIGSEPDGTAVDTSTVGRYALTVTATDIAGNSFARTINYSVGDVTGPTLTISSPLDDASYARGADIAVHYTCRDETGGSGIASCSGSLADGAKLDTSRLGRFSMTVSATDLAGNRTSEIAHFSVGDVTAPTISITRPTGAALDFGSRVRVDFTCADEADGSQLALCHGTQHDGALLATAIAGVHRFVVVAQDAAGNRASRTVRYSVRRAPVVLSGLSLSDTSFVAAGRSGLPAERGTTIRFVLSRKAQVRIEFVRADGGSSSHVIKRAGVPGANETAFSGRVRGLPLSPGRWRLRITAKDASGNTTPVRSRRFTVLW